MDEHIITGIGGVVGGTLGTIFMQQGMKLSQKLPEGFKGPSMSADPGDFMARKAEGLVTKNVVPEGVHGTFSSSLHWGYGIGWGTLLGALAPELPIRSFGGALIAGAGMGAACWAAGYLGWLPAAGIVEPVHRQGAGNVASALATHVIYGVIASVPIAVLGWMLHDPRPRASFAIGKAAAKVGLLGSFLLFLAKRPRLLFG